MNFGVGLEPANEYFYAGYNNIYSYITCYIQVI